jgi:hypothetical protein
MHALSAAIGRSPLDAGSLARPAAQVRKGMEDDDPTMPTPAHLERLFGLDDEEGS